MEEGAGGIPLRGVNCWLHWHCEFGMCGGKWLEGSGELWAGGCHPATNGIDNMCCRAAAKCMERKKDWRTKCSTDSGGEEMSCLWKCPASRNEERMRLAIGAWWRMTLVIFNLITGNILKRHPAWTGSEWMNRNGRCVMKRGRTERATWIAAA